MYPVSGGTARFPHYAFGGARRRVVRLVLVAAGGDRRADRGARDDHVRPALLLRERLAEDRRAAQHVLTATGIVVAVVLMALFTADQLPRRPQARAHQQRGDLVEGRRPAADDLRAGHRQLPREQLHRRRRLQPLRRQGHARRGLDERHHLRAARVRAGRPARRRERATRSATSRARSSARSSSASSSTSRCRSCSSARCRLGRSATPGRTARYTTLTGPFAQLATLVGVGWLAAILYIDAIISPGGTGLIYTTGDARGSPTG